MQLKISIQRFLIVSNLKIKLPKLYVTFIIILVFSIIFNSPSLMVQDIVPINNTTGLYKLQANLFGKSKLGKWLIVCINVFRSVVLISLILIVNILTLIRFRKCLENKKRMKLRETRESKVSKSMTRMVIIMGFMNFFGNLPNLVGYILQQFSDMNTIFYRVWSMMANLIILLNQGSEIFILYWFNRLYRQVFQDYIIGSIRNAISKIFIKK
ncbi:unnamed protein product [Brachionus calyciflorus]|uniref:G-protein coupled receptors family 1 profile domain-containing protein n=1 Tax=Brachionus calyciflorus TaxID=104777 RepID=A0A813PNA1_9BILA|nr:unnamed protein product [Brachionus calyciflorus]